MQFLFDTNLNRIAEKVEVNEYYLISRFDFFDEKFEFFIGDVCSFGFIVD